MLGSVPIRTCLTLLINILPYDLGIEGIIRTEDIIKYKGSHQSTIPILHLAQIFRQIAEFVALYINLELLEASKLCRKFTLIVMSFHISTSDTVAIS